MFRTMLAILAGALAFPAAVLAQASPIQMSVLPNARAGVIDTDITFFATIVNTSETEANSCRHTGFDTPNGLPAGVTGTVEVFALDESRNIEGSANSFFTIPAGGQRDLLVSFNIDAPMDGTLSLLMRCQFERDEFRFAPVYPGVNDFQLTVTAAPGPDIVMIGDTISRDGVMRVGTAPRVGLFVIAAVNIGADGTGLVAAPSYLGYSSLNRLRTEICETDAAGACISPRGATVTVANWTNGQVRTFAAFFVQAQYTGIPFYPDALRAAVEIGTPPEAMDGPARPLDTPPNLSGVSRTSTAVDAAALVDAYAAQLNSLTLAQSVRGTFQCGTQVEFPLGNRANRTGGLIVVSDSSISPNAARGEGYARILPTPQPGAETIPPVYLQPLAIEVPDRTQTAPQPITVRIYGQGQDAPTPIDQILNGTTRYDPLRGLIIEQDGSASLDNDFDFPTRTRCVPVPPVRDNPPDPDPRESMLGGFEVVLPSNGNVLGGVTVTSREEGGTQITGIIGEGVEFRILELASEQIEEDFSLTEIMMSWMALGAPSEVAVSQVERDTGLVIPTSPASQTPGRADCAVVIDRDSTRANAGDDRANDDATIRIWRRTDIDLNEGECVL